MFAQINYDCRLFTRRINDKAYATHNVTIYFSCENARRLLIVICTAHGVIKW